MNAYVPEHVVVTLPDLTGATVAYIVGELSAIAAEGPVYRFVEAQPTEALARVRMSVLSAPYVEDKDG